MATRRNEIFRDHTTIRSGTAPTADPASVKPRKPDIAARAERVAPLAPTVTPIDIERADDTDASPPAAEAEPRELSNAGLSGSHPEITDIARRDMIERAAYARAEQRGFAPGDEVADWLAAERDVELFLAGGHPPDGVHSS